MPMRIPVPEGPKPTFLVGNLPELIGGVHVGFPNLIQRYGDPGIFTFQMPSNMSPGALPLDKFGGPTIVCADPDLLEDMYNRPDEFDKKLFKYTRMGDIAGLGLFASDDDQEEHDMSARVLLPAFSLDGMKVYFDIILEQTEILCNQLVDLSKDRGVDAHPLLSKFTFEVIAQVGFGMKYNALTQDCAFLNNFNELMHVAEEDSMIAFCSSAKANFLLSGGVGDALRARDEQQKEMGRVLEAKKEAVKKGETCPVKDMCTRMFTEADPKDGKLLSDEIVNHNALTFLVAGHDSTSSAITMLLYNISLHPEVEQKVYLEVAREIGDRRLEFEDLSKLTYCTQVVKENLRVAPPAHSFVKNSPLDRETNLGKYRIPAGSSILVMLWALHYNPKLYPEPFKFKPERWEGEVAARRSPYAWLPFSYGSRGCIGQQLTLIEQRVALAMIVRKNYVRLDQGSKLKITHPLFMNVGGVFLRVIPRVPGGNAAPPASLALSNLSRQSTGLGRVEKLAGKRVVVLYGSNMGTCLSLSAKLVEKFSKLGMSCQKAPLDALASKNPIERLELPRNDEGFVLVVTSTYNGAPPENATAFASWLRTEEAASALKDVNYSVFGCGNSQWAATFQKFPRTVDASLDAAGAIRMADLGTGDIDGGQVDLHFARWTLSVVIHIYKSEDIPLPDALADQLHEKFAPYEVFLWEGRTCKDLSMDFMQSTFGSVIDTPVLNKMKVWLATAPINRELVNGEGRCTRHIEITLPEGQTYCAGDHLGIYAANPHEIVLQYLRRAKVAPDAIVKIEGPPKGGLVRDKLFPAAETLAYFVELQQLAKRSQLNHLARKAEGEAKARLKELASYDSNAFEEYVVAGRRTLLELLDEFPDVPVTLAELLSMLPETKPRFYSISSSPKVLPHAVNITVGVVSGVSPTGRQHKGMCSNYLSSQPVIPSCLDPKLFPHGHAPLVAFVMENGSFRLPASKDTPVIMVGPGTGLAPMRGFIQERVASGAKNNLLFFGCRSDAEFLYREELEAWQASKALELHVAFSRKEGIPKTYVQQLIEKESARIADLIMAGAHIYVCGDVSQMAPAVRKTLESICETAGLGGAEHVQRMEEQGRYSQDVWAAQSM